MGRKSEGQCADKICLSDKSGHLYKYPNGSHLVDLDRWQRGGLSLGSLSLTLRHCQFSHQLESSTGDDVLGTKEDG